MRRAFMSALTAACAITLEACSTETGLDPTSNCNYRADARWIGQGYLTRHHDPRACPVFIFDKDVDPRPLPSRAYRVDIWDVQSKATWGQPIFTDFKDARGGFVGNASASFYSTDIGQPPGTLAASIVGYYFPGSAGFAFVAMKVDTAINHTYVNNDANQRANVFVYLPYQLETAPSITGLSTVEHGATALYGASASKMRQVPTYQWYLNGQAVSGETRPTFSKTFNTSGTHQIKVRATSAIGSVFWATKTVVVPKAPQCDDGGGGGDGPDLAIACPGD